MNMLSFLIFIIGISAQLLGMQIRTKKLKKSEEVPNEFVVPKKKARKKVPSRRSAVQKKAKLEGERWDLLEYAVHKGDYSECKRLLKLGVKAPNPWIVGEHPLATAAHQGRSDICLLLLKNGIDLEPEGVGYRPLMAAAWAGHKNIVYMFIAFGAEVKTGTALHWAAENNQRSVCKILLSKGASINGRDEKGKTALHYAISGTGEPKTIGLLLGKGADINVQDNDGVTPLLLACKWCGPKRIRYLLEKGALFVKDNQGQTAMHYAVSSLAAEDVLPILLENTIPVNVADDNGVTPLMLAMNSFFKKEVAEILLKNGASLSVRDRDGKEAIHYAVEGAFDAVVFLLKNGAKVNAQTNDGSTPLDLVNEHYLTTPHGINKEWEKISRLLRSSGDVEGKIADGPLIRELAQEDDSVKAEPGLEMLVGLRGAREIS